MSLGPDNWNNAPSGSNPIGDLRAYLGVIQTAVNSWQLKGNVETWQERISRVTGSINLALQALPTSDVFATTQGRKLYEDAISSYQQLKDTWTLSPDRYFDEGEQQTGVTNKDAWHPSEWFDKAMAWLRTVGIVVAVLVLGAVAVVVVFAFKKIGEITVNV